MIRFIIYAFVAGLVLGYLKGCSDEKADFDEYRGGVEALGKAAHERSVARNEELARAKKGVEDAHKNDVDGRNRRHALELERVRNFPGGSLLPKEPAGTGRAMQPLCFDRAKLDAGLSAAVREFLEETAKLVQRGEDHASDLTFWRAWAGQVGACLTPEGAPAR